MNVTYGPFAKCFPGQNLEFQSWLKTNKTRIKTEARWPPYQSSQIYVKMASLRTVKCCFQGPLPAVGST